MKIWQNVFLFLRKLEAHMGYAGSYHLKLRCDHEDHEKPKQITYKGMTILDCVNQARKAGWIVSNGFKVCQWVLTHHKESQKGKGYCVCPEHNKKVKKDLINA